MPEHTFRYPAHSPLSIELFQTIDLGAALEHIQLTYKAYWQHLADLARDAMKRDEVGQARILWLLSDLCSLRLYPPDNNNPFRPYAEFEDGRSFVLADLSGEDHDFIQDVFDVLDDGLVRARVADVLWVKPGKRDIRHANAAIDGYATVPIEEAIWWEGGRECTRRAVGLALSIRTAAGDRLQHLTQAIFAAMELAKDAPSLLIVSMAETVLEYRLGHSRAADLPPLLEDIGQASNLAGNIQKARKCFECALKFHQVQRDPEAAARMKALIAQSWVTESELRSQRAEAQPLVSVSYLEKALQLYRDIPMRYRIAMNLESELPRLRQRITEAGARTVEQMQIITTPGVDITGLVERIQTGVAGKSLGDALKAMTEYFPFASPVEAREGAIRTLRTGIVSALTGATFFNRMGRVIAKCPPLSLGTEFSESDEQAIDAQMISNHRHTIGLTVQGCVMPALAIIQREHCIREEDLVALAQASSVVPPGRERMVGKGLYCGFSRDFAMAAHFLIPQMENIVRYHMQAAGLTTSNTDRDGIENENGLSTLMTVEGVDDLFGDRVAFEIRAVFCSPFGPNLRNEFAHGLIDDDQLYSEAVVYVWWFMLKLISEPVWIAVTHAIAEHARSAQSDGVMGQEPA